MKNGHAARGFSLIEILIVVTIIGILAAIAVPKFANASQNARENTVKHDLQLLRTQIGLYRTQHQDVWPGYPAGNTSQTPTEAVTQDQLTKFTDLPGNTSDTTSAVYKYGPYVNEMPVNPLNGLRNWKILASGDAFTPDNTTGWLYQPSTGMLKANVAGNDTAGKSIVDY